MTGLRLSLDYSRYPSLPRAKRKRPTSEAAPDKDALHREYLRLCRMLKGCDGDAFVGDFSTIAALTLMWVMIGGEPPSHLISRLNIDCYGEDDKYYGVVPTLERLGGRHD